MPKQTLHTFASFISRKPVAVLSVVIGLLIISVLNIPNFKLEASSDSLVLENDEDLKFYREISNEYSTVDFLVVLFTPKKPLFDPETIKNVRTIADQLENLKGIDNVLSYLDAPLLFSPKMSMSELSDNLRTIEEKGVDLDLAKLEFQASPLYTELLVSKDGTTTALQLNLLENIEYDKAIQKRYKLRQQLIDSKEEDIEEQLNRVNSLISSLNNQEDKIRDKLIAQQIVIEMSLKSCPASTFRINTGIKTKRVVKDVTTVLFSVSFKDLLIIFVLLSLNSLFIFSLILS